MKIGQIDGGSGLVEILDIIKEDIPEDSSVAVTPNVFGSGRVIRGASVAKIAVEFDRLSIANYGAIRKVMNDRRVPVKIYLAHPADATQVLDFNSISKPSSTNVFYTLSDNSADAAIGSATEIDTTDYAKIAAIDLNTFTLTQNTNLYSYMFLKFKASAFRAAYSEDAVRRLTLFLHNFSCQVNGRYGFKVDILDLTGGYIEVGRWFYHYAPTSEAEYIQRTIAIRPFYNFTAYQNFINDSTGDIIIRIRSLYPRTVAGTYVTMKLNYVSLLINGYGVAWINPDNFTYRSAYTGEGFTGKMELVEL